ncbi:FtsK/SpoIIIE family protein [Promicromonospora umidemergens]|nr:FtsK/SpoIIIE family protein [Promicromonospora umidemergens]
MRALAGAARRLVVDARSVAMQEESAAVARLSAAKRAQASVAVLPVQQQANTLDAQDRRQLAEQAAVLAPGAAGWEPGDGRWRRGNLAAGARWAGFVRVGTAAGTGVPVVLPLLGTTGWCVLPSSAVTEDDFAEVSTDQVLPDGRAVREGVAARATDAPDDLAGRLGQDRSACLTVVQQAVLRVVAASEPFGVQVETFDPQVTGVMGVLGAVTSRFGQVVSRPVHDAAGLRSVLAGLGEVSSMRAHRMAQAGLSKFEQLQARSRSSDAHRVLVVLDYPRGVDQTAQADLVRLAQSGQARGISLLVTFDPTAQPAPGVNPDDLLGPLSTVVAGGDELWAEALPGVSVVPDGPVVDTEAVCRDVVERTSKAALPTIGFTETLPPRETWWVPIEQGEGLEAAIGFTDADPAVVRLRSGNPPLPHVLVAGAIGQGKSNLLLALIHNLAVRYSPDDLEMYLIDMKHGVEFARLGPGPGRKAFLPHAKVLGIHADRTFGVAVLRHLNQELVARSQVFKQMDVTDIAQIPPGGLAGLPRPARMLVVLDEFQVLLDGDDDLATEAVGLLERIARIARSYGVHMVLSTQTLDGTPKLTAKRDSIFGQVPVRIALKTTSNDSQVVLGAGNSAAAGLQFRGQAILNDNYGATGDNRQIQVAHADPDVLADLRRELWERAGGERVSVPRVFHLAEPANLRTTVGSIEPGRDVTGAPNAWAGLPVAVTEQPATIPVRHEPGAGVFIVGDGPADALGVITGLTLSTVLAARGAAAEIPKVVLLDATAADPATTVGKRALTDVLFAAGCSVEHVTSHESITARIFTLRDQIRDRQVPGPLLVLGHGLHAVAGMTQNPEGLMESPASALDDVLKHGPGAGVVTFAWWNRLHVVTEQLGFKRSSVSAYIFLKHPQDGVRSALGQPLLRWASDPARCLVWDGIGVDPVLAVPFAPLTASEGEQLALQVRPTTGRTEATR